MAKIAEPIAPVIAVDRKDVDPLHKQVYDGFRMVIVRGNLHPGQRVPSSRSLAVELGISRIPVLNAYAQLLAEGYFESRTGAGTSISSTLPDQVSPPVRSASSAGIVGGGPRPISHHCERLPSMQNVLPWLRGRRGAFSVGQPALDQVPKKIWSRL